VLAQAGEGSVRDSLSALDQAIACCGMKLNATETRALLGMFSLDSLAQVSQALLEQDSRRMLDVVMELERNGRNLQHFCRELARYFRNLLVVKVAGVNTRLIAATPQEQERLAEIAAPFAEEDLTRYLQITLDVFKDLQVSLQPRLHLEIGLLKLVQAGRLTGIEEELARLGGESPGGGSPKPVAAKPAASRIPAAAPPPPVSLPPAPAPIQASGDLRDRLHAALTELGMMFTADALEHSQVIEKTGELQFVTTVEFKLAMDPKELQKAVQHTLGRQMKITVSVGEPEVSASPPVKPKASNDDETTERALSHPEVKRFREKFPDAHVRAVRNLKE
jgi:DNA polymerase III subunit gamma/tau